MRDIMAQLRYLDAEQEARANRQQIARTIRAGKQRAPQSPPIYNPPTKPLTGGGVQPVWVLNMARVR